MMKYIISQEGKGDADIGKPVKILLKPLVVIRKIVKLKAVFL